MKTLLFLLIFHLVQTATGQSLDAKKFNKDSLGLENILGTKSAFELGVEIDTASKEKKPFSGKTFSLAEKEPELVVIKSQINMRFVPRVNTRVVTKLKAGTHLKNLGKKNNWYKVTDGTHTGYIREDMLAWSHSLTEKQKQLVQTSKKAEKVKELAGARKRNEEKKRAQEELMARKLAEKKLAEKREKLAAEKRLAAKLKADQERIEKEKQARIQKEKLLAAKQKEEEIKREKERQQALAREKKEAERLAEIEREKEKEEARIKRLLALKKIKDDEEKRQAEIIRVQQENQMKLLLEKKKREEEIERKKQLQKKEKIVYSSFGRRDPFIPVEAASLNESDLNIDQMKLVGIIWDQEDPLAVLEHNTEAGISVTLKEGDRIANGKVAFINYEKITFEILEYGVYRSYTLKLVN